MRRFVRLLVRFAVALAVVVGVAILAVQVVLWDGRIPRRLVESGMTEQTGLRTEVGRVSAGWFGVTILEDVSLWLPLEDEPLASVPRLKVGHSELLLLLLGRPLTIRTADLDRPVIRLREGADGQWNIERAIALLEMAQAGTGEATPGPLRLPDLDIPEATVEVRRAGGRMLTIPMSLAAETDEAGGWSFKFAAPARGELSGRIAPGGDWLHDVAFDVHNISEVAGLWLDDVPSPLLARGTWRGQTVGGGVAGTARLDEVVVGSERARGTLGIQSADIAGGPAGAIRLLPRGLVIESPILAEVNGGPLTVHRGDLVVGDNTVSASEVVVEWLGSSAVFQGGWDGAKRTAQLAASWSGAVERHDLTQRGTLSVLAELPRAGAMTARLELTSSGRGLGGEWEAVVQAEATGAGPEQASAKIAAPTLRWTDAEGTLDFGGMAARLDAFWPLVRLRSVEVPGARVVAGRGEVDARTLAWSAELDVRDWEVPRLGAGVVELALLARGRGRTFEVENARAAAAGVEVSARGRYNPAESVPLTASWSAATLAGEGAFLPEDLGRWRLEGSVEGAAAPLSLRLSGRGSGEGVQGPREQLPALVFTWRGELDERGIAARTDPFEVLGGMCILRGRYAFGDGGLAGAGGAGGLSISLAELPLEEVARVAGAPVEIGGALTAELQVAAPEWDWERLTVSGQWSVDRPVADAYGVDRGRGRIRTERGRVNFSDILLELGAGRITGSAGFELAEMHKLDLALASTDWPLTLQGTQLRAEVDASAQLRIDLSAGQAEGSLSLATPLWVNGSRYGELAADAELRGRTVTLGWIALEAAGGSLDGSATVPLDDPLAARADLVWRGFNLAELVRPFADVEGLEGGLAGSLRIDVATDPRALEPLRIELTVLPEDASLRGSPIGDAVFIAYAGPGRVVLQQSAAQLAGGRVEVWGRVSRHGDEPFAHLQTTFTDLGVEDLLRMADPELATATGRLTGRLTVGGYLREPRRMFGDGAVEITRADLGTLPVVSHLYGLLNLQFAGRDSTGRGRAELRLEENTLILRRMEYFNRGTDVFASARVEDIWRGGESPIAGVAVARVRPLRDLGLPFMRDLDDIISAVQTGGASVRIGGTLDNRVIRPAPFEEVGAFMRGIFGGSGR